MGPARCHRPAETSRYIGGLVGTVERWKDHAKQGLSHDHALVEAIHHPKERCLDHPLHCRRQVRWKCLAVRCAIRQQIDLRVIHLFREALKKASEEFAKAQSVGCIAQWIALGRPLPEVVIRGPQAVDGIAEKAQVEEDVACGNRNRVVNLVAGKRLHARVRGQMGENAGLFDASIAVGRIEPREAVAKVAVEDVLDGGARVFQDVIVQNDEAQRDVLRNAANPERPRRA